MCLGRGGTSKNRAAGAPLIRRRSKLMISIMVGRTSTLPSMAMGRSFTMPNEKPMGKGQLPTSMSTPYLAGDETITEPPRCSIQRFG